MLVPVQAWHVVVVEVEDAHAVTKSESWVAVQALRTCAGVTNAGTSELGTLEAGVGQTGPVPPLLEPLEECDDVACTDCFSTNASAASIDQCESSAESGACASYLSQTDSACANDFADGGAANTCSDVTYILNLFCGTGG